MRLAEHFEPARLRAADLLRGLGPRNVEDLDGHPDDLRERDGAVGRLTLRRHRAGRGLVLRSGASFPQQSLGAPVDGVVVLGVDEHQRAVLPGDRHEPEGLRVAQRQAGGGEVLERAHAARDHAGKLPQHPIVDAPDDHVEGVVDERAAREPMVVGHHFREVGGEHLVREADDGGGAAARGGAGGGLEGVGVLPEALRLLDVAVAVHAARQDETPACVHRLVSGAEPGPKGPNAPVGDPDVAVLETFPDRDATAPHHQVELRHLPPPELPHG